MITVPGAYRNIKNEKVYHVILIARNTTNDSISERMVVYYSKEEDIVYVREINEFEEKFRYVN